MRKEEVRAGSRTCSSLRSSGSQLPQSNDAEHHEIGEQERRHGWRAVDEVVKGMNGRAAQISHRVQHKSPKTDDGFQDKNRRA